MKLDPRQNTLFRMIYKQRSIAVEKLAKAFPFSRETLRKELIYLESLRLIERQYGRISLIDNEFSRGLIQEEQRLSATQRKERILEILREHKIVRLSVLAARMKVSLVTIRSDLADMVQKGIVIRKHGAVSLLSPGDSQVDALNTDDFSSKTHILGQHILLHISPGDTVYFGNSAIARFVAISLPQNANISIVSDNVEIISILRKRNYTSPIYILPGKLFLESGIMEVKYAESFFSGIHIDKAFFMIASYVDKTYFMESREAVTNAVAISTCAKKLYFILDSITLDKRGEYSFPYHDYRDKVQEILIDDNVSRSTVSYLFPRRNPVVICGFDYTLKIGRRRKYRIGFLVNADRNYFIQAVYNSILESVAIYDNLSLVIRKTEGGFFSTVKNTDILLNDHPDLIINYSLCTESVRYIGEKCRNRGIKLITIDMQDSSSIYFGADNAVAGILAGNHTINFIQKCWHGQLDRIIVLIKHGMDTITNLRVMSVVERIQTEICCSFPDPEIIDWDNPNDKPKEKLLQLLLNTPKTYHLFFIVFNLSHLLAIHDIIVQYRNANNTIIVGQNFNEQIKELMKMPNSPILGCVDYNPEKYGIRIFDIAVRMLNGETVDILNYTTHTWISKDTVLDGNFEKGSP